ncbi:PorT family protein [bacterium]|nr:PorT family protein [bacterium]
MKRTIFPLIALGLVLSLATSAAAIDLIHAGVKGGVTVANMSADPSDSELADSRNGFAIGGYLGIPLGMTPFTIQPEALFTMKGDSEEADGVTGSMKLDYIEVPVLAKASFLPMAPAKPSLFFGPAVAYNLSAKTAVEGGGLDGETDVKDTMKSMDFGLVVGAGLDMSLAGGAKSLGIDVRYTHGLTNTIDSDTGAEAKNKTISIMGTIGFL